jgi:DNA invertase Pin-like site-specific DNA recombinase
MRVARYFRVSRSEQDVGLQDDETAELIRRRGWTLVGTYVDHGVSGARTSRPALDRLREDARDARFDAVVTWRADRLFRSLGAMISTKSSAARLKSNPMFRSKGASAPRNGRSAGAE